VSIASLELWQMGMRVEGRYSVEQAETVTTAIRCYRGGLPVRQRRWSKSESILDRHAELNE
jgi:hypothetical protein